MTLKRWCFSFKGRIGRGDFWAWLSVLLLSMLMIFYLAEKGWLALNEAAFSLVLLLWPTAAIVVKRLHDRNKSGGWGFLLILAWLLGAGNWVMFPEFWQWGLGRFLPWLIFTMVLLDCGVFRGTPGVNRFGEKTEKAAFLSWL